MNQPLNNEQEPEQGSDAEQPLVAHLTELRDRLLRSVVAILVVLIGLFPFSNRIYTFVSKPLRVLLPHGTHMIATEVASPFLTPFKLSAVTAIVLVMPYILYQAWSFIAPGMYKSEKRIAVPMLVSSVVLFYAGLAFAYYVVFPLVFGFFSGVGPAGVSYTPDISKFLDTALKLFFAFGLAFEIPIATVLMIWAGITTPEALAQKRPYVVIICFVVGMLLTPPDVISQTLLAVPMWLLFESGVFFGRLVKARKTEAETDPDTADSESN